MATIEDYVRVYESTDGGSGDPADTLWQFIVGKQAVVTENHHHAETIRLAIKTSSKVRVSYDEKDGNKILQVRMEFAYICESKKIEPCDSAAGQPTTICETHRYAPCEPREPGSSRKGKTKRTR